MRNGKTRPRGEQNGGVGRDTKSESARGAYPDITRPVLITGGAGFIGTNLANRLLERGTPVIIYDNLSRPGVEKNVEWLQSVHGQLLRVRHEDVRNARALRQSVKEVCAVFHLAAQVAVTTSLVDPIEDFEINARGTLNLLEALRGLETPRPLVFTSTNKVYGDLQDIALQSKNGRYEPVDRAIGKFGFGESRSLHCHSPYGCSKGAACQYVQDYARTFGLPTVVFRMSCIYGPHQFGTEDQGWVAHFLFKTLEGSTITLYGDGRQVRDVLFVEDLVDAFLLAQQHISRVSGQAFNIGGGPDNTTSLLELIEQIGHLHGCKPEVRFDCWRLADQLYYVSDIRKFRSATGWSPRTRLREGISQLYHWALESSTASDTSWSLAGTPAAPRTAFGAKNRNGQPRPQRLRRGDSRNASQIVTSDRQ